MFYFLIQVSLRMAVPTSAESETIHTGTKRFLESESNVPELLCPAGQNWEWLERSSEFPLVIGDTLYQVRERIYKSIDYGKVWSDYAELPSGLKDIRMLAVEKGQETLVYLFGVRNTRENGSRSEVWVSKDMMKTFELVNPNAAYGFRRLNAAVARPDGSLYIHGGRKNNKAQVFESWVSENGQQWERVLTMTDIDDKPVPASLNGLVAVGSDIYAVAIDESNLTMLGLYKSVDSGESWNSVDVPFAKKSAICCP